MSTRFQFRLALFGGVLVCAAFAAAEDNSQSLDRKFQSAVAQYDSGHFAEAAAKLEELVPYAPNSFEIQELLGLVYASQSQDSKALNHLEAAVRLKPDSATARTNYAACLSHSGKQALAGEQFKKALELAPGDYDANHNLGEYYIQAGQITEAQPLLERAHEINPSSYDNGYDLAMAYFQTGQTREARQLIEQVVLIKNTGELHDLRGEIEEKDGHYVAAVNEFEAAAHLDPSEDNLFDWGSELLLHRTYEPAIDVFQQAVQRFPNSPRIIIGLGMALYSRGKYDDAVKALIRAADLNPADSRCYLFLSKAYDSSPGQAEDVIGRFRRYAELKPGNALAQYYYAMSLWKGKRTANANVDPEVIKSLLQKAVDLDDSLADAHVQLGNLYADQHDYEKSIPQYLRALQLSPNLADAHYRLAQDYVHVGQKDRAQTEFDLYQRFRAEHMAEVDKERAEVRQFVYSEKSTASSKP